MTTQRGTWSTIVLAATGLVVLALVLASAVFALALVAPVVGAWLAWQKIKTARSLWRSGGRFPVGDAIRIIEPGRARALALAETGAALSTLVAGGVPALWLFVSLGAGVGAGVVAVLGLAWAGHARQKLLESASPIEVLPPEPRDDERF